MGREQLGQLDDEQRRVVTRCGTPAPLVGIGVWSGTALIGVGAGGSGGEDREPPLPFTPLDPEDFLAFVAQYEAESGERIRPQERPRGRWRDLGRHDAG